MPPKPRALVSWSSGKDSAFALHSVRQSGEVEIAGLLTTVSSQFGRIAMHGVREALLDAQAEALRLRWWKVPIPWPCSHAIYEEEMFRALPEAQTGGIDRIAFCALLLAARRGCRKARW